MFAAARARLGGAIGLAVRGEAPAASLSVTSFAALRGVSVRYGDAPAILDRVSLEIPRGSITCLVGPSGSGKSTILNLLAGLAAPTEGAVVRAGGDTSVVLQEAGLMPWMTLLDNVAFPLALRGAPRRARRERAAEQLRRVHLLRFRDAFPHELSGGMQQRGSIARALVTEPEAVLFDEPFAALDGEMRARLLGEVEGLYLASRTSMVFVTHDVGEAARLADRVIVLGARPGRVLSTIHVDAARPRRADGAEVRRAAREIEREIRDEVEKIQREEADDGWSARAVDPARDPRRDLGGGI